VGGQTENKSGEVLSIAHTVNDVALMDARVVSERVFADNAGLHHIAIDGSSAERSSTDHDKKLDARDKTIGACYAGLS
jgi:hypothetical protein